MCHAVHADYFLQTLFCHHRRPVRGLVAWIALIASSHCGCCRNRQCTQQERCANLGSGRERGKRPSNGLCSYLCSVGITNCVLTINLTCNLLRVDPGHTLSRSITQGACWRPHCVHCRSPPSMGLHAGACGQPGGPGCMRAGRGFPDGRIRAQTIPHANPSLEVLRP